MGSLGQKTNKETRKTKEKQKTNFKKQKIQPGLPLGGSAPG